MEHARCSYSIFEDDATDSLPSGDTTDSLPVDASEVDADAYWRWVTNGKSEIRRDGSKPPFLLLTFGPPGAGKSTAIIRVLGLHKNDARSCVRLDPDEMRYFCADYRRALCGRHAATLRMQQLSNQLLEQQPAPLARCMRAAMAACPSLAILPPISYRSHLWTSPVGEYVERGFTNADGSFLALPNAAKRSSHVVHKHFHINMTPEGEIEPESHETFTLRAIKDRYNVIFDTPGAYVRPRAALVRIARQQGYQIVVCGVFAPKQELLTRLRTRSAQTGRFVPDDFALQMHDKIFPGASNCSLDEVEDPEELSHILSHGAFDGYRQLLDVGDEIYLFTNNNVGATPVLLRHELIGEGEEAARAEAAPALAEKSETSERARRPSITEEGWSRARFRASVDRGNIGSLANLLEA